MKKKHKHARLFFCTVLSPPVTIRCDIAQDSIFGMLRFQQTQARLEPRYTRHVPSTLSDQIRSSRHFEEFSGRVSGDQTQEEFLNFDALYFLELSSWLIMCSNPNLSISHYYCRRRRPPAASLVTLCVALVCCCPLLLRCRLISCLTLLLLPNGVASHVLPNIATSAAAVLLSLDCLGEACRSSLPLIIVPLPLPSSVVRLVVTIRLTKENYLPWLAVMTMGIAGRSRIAYINGRKPDLVETSGVCDTWFLEDNQVKTWIVNSVSADIQPLILQKKTARDMWVILEQMYSQKKKAIQTYQLMKTVYGLRQGNLFVADYYGALKAKWEDLDYYSDITWHCPQDQALYVAKDQILNSGEVSSIEDVYSRVEAEEQRRLVTTKGKRDLMSYNERSALVSRGPGGYKGNSCVGDWIVDSGATLHMTGKKIAARKTSIEAKARPALLDIHEATLVKVERNVLLLPFLFARGSSSSQRRWRLRKASLKHQVLGDCRPHDGALKNKSRGRGVAESVEWAKLENPTPDHAGEEEIPPSGLVPLRLVVSEKPMEATPPGESGEEVGSLAGSVLHWGTMTTPPSVA
ncbi:hypothetical protein EJ110_NYTH48004 [Nymphaea thermarum]|nr:hypothetical protein EJ110_NYTH48004 [Nymphaea thermarum]